MENAKAMAAAVLITMLALPLYASGEATIPYIEIEAPMDGQTVHDSTELVVVAEGYSLKDPYVSISGESIGTSYPLYGCTFTSPIEPGDESGTDVLPRPSSMRMVCNTDIDLKGFQGEKVKLTAGVSESGKRITDSVGLYVSGQCV